MINQANIIEFWLPIATAIIVGLIARRSEKNFRYVVVAMLVLILFKI